MNLNQPRTLATLGGSSVEPATLMALLRRRAELNASASAYTFLQGDGGEASSITYGELDRRARALAARLQASAGVGERALILVAPGLDYITAFFGCLYAGLMAVPVPPPQRARALPRLLSIVRDCRPTLALTTPGTVAAVREAVAQNPELGALNALQWVALDEALRGPEGAWAPPALTADSVAFFQYTSGSTGAPKGVTLTHGNLLHNQRLIRGAFGHDDGCVMVGWLPPYHDMGLIGVILQPLYLGVPCVQMAPQDFLASPLRWLTAISRYRGTTSGGPNFAYELCVRETTPEQRAGLDLSSWKVAFNGAEPVRASTLERFAEAFKGAGFRREAFYPCYGLAEATLFVSGGLPEAPAVACHVERTALERGRVVRVDEGRGDALSLVGCGRPERGQEVRVVDPESLRPCADEEVGEIWVAGDSVARGYWGREEDTTRTFEARTAGGEGPYLRTGDLGFLSGGELYVTGRLKDMIIVRGRNLYPQDIELTVEQSHPGLRAGGGAAFSVDVDDEERLVIVHELAPGLVARAEAVDEALRRAVAERHEVSVYAVAFIAPRALSRTTSGKVQRGACRARFLGGTLEAVWQSNGGAQAPAEAPPASPLEATLAEIWARVLGRDRVGRHDEFLSVGGDSLRAAQVSARVREACGVEVPPDYFFESTTIATLAARIEARRAEAVGIGPGAVAAPAERPALLPLSLVQERLYFLDRLVGGAPVYHVAASLRLAGELDAGALGWAVTALVARHEALRTRFVAAGGQIVQQIEAPAPVGLPVHDLLERPEGERGQSLRAHLREEARRPFELDRGPPLRFSLIRVAEREHMLSIAAHHLVVDGWSMNVLLGDLARLYSAYAAGEAPSLPPLPVQYADYALWQRGPEQVARHERELRYWRERFRDPVAPLALAAGRPRPSVQTHAGAREEFELPAWLVGRLSALGRARGATLFATVAAGILALLHRYTGQTDLCIGAPVAGRSQVAHEGVAGCFINTLPLRVDLAGDPRVEELLARVCATVAEVRANQGVPFERIVEALSLPRTLSHAPLFQVLFAMEPELAPVPEVPGLSLEVERVDTGTAQFDLTFELTANARGARGAWEYNTDLFDASTVARLTRHLLALLEGFVASPKAALSSLPMLGDDEKKQILVDWNATEQAYGDGRLVHEQFEAQAALDPQRIAVLFDEQRVTYGELNARANRLAHALRRRGVGPDMPVAVYAERSVELVAAFLAVLKAGGAYVPLEPDYPDERLAFMLEDSDARVVLGPSRLGERLPGARARLLGWDADRALLEREPTADLGLSLDPDNLVYIIYTSGSTGRPKGAGNTHRGLRNRLLWMRERFGPAADERVLHKTPFGFDVSAWELFWPLMSGAVLVLARAGEQRDNERLLELIERHQVTSAHFVPPMLEAFLETPGVASAGRSLRRVICSGDALSVELEGRFFERLGAELHNLYGPTEASIEVTAWACAGEAGATSVPIGRPIANTQAYVLDAAGHPVPAGVAGELYLGGVGLARGYHRRPGLTAERFVPDPFGPPGARLYRTGDRARFRADGAIEFLGRLDGQVKLRGQRIELGEIEAGLRGHPSVREAVAVVRDEARVGKRIVAYVTAREGASVEAEALRAWLGRALPSAMVPSSIRVLAALPLSPNGKIDRGALPAHDDPADAPSRDVAPPRTELERAIAAIWQDVLPVRQVGVDDNFFDLGGHSLLLTRVQGRLREVTGGPVPMLLLLQHPTVASLAAALSGVSDEALSPDGGERERDRQRGARERRAELFARRRGRETAK